MGWFSVAIIGVTRRRRGDAGTFVGLRALVASRVGRRRSRAQGAPASRRASRSAGPLGQRKPAVGQHHPSARLGEDDRRGQRAPAPAARCQRSSNALRTRCGGPKSAGCSPPAATLRTCSSRSSTPTRLDAADLPAAAQAQAPRGVPRAGQRPARPLAGGAIPAARARREEAAGPIPGRKSRLGAS